MKKNGFQRYPWEGASKTSWALDATEFEKTYEYSTSDKSEIKESLYVVINNARGN